MVEKIRALPPVAFVVEVTAECGRVGVARSAAALSYFLILTLFPLLLCVHHFIGLFRLDLEQALFALDRFLPAGAAQVLEDYLAYVAAVQSPPLVWAGVFTLLVSASAGLRTLFHTLDDLYRLRPDRGLGRILLSVWLSALFLVTIYLSVAVIFTGDWFFRLLERALPRAIPLGALSDLWRWLRYLVLFCFLLLLVLAVYRFGLPRRVLDRREGLGAALVTATALAAGSGVFSWFIGLSSRYALVYGSLASLILLLVWLYFCGYVLLLGAVVCRVLGRRKNAGMQKEEWDDVS